LTRGDNIKAALATRKATGVRVGRPSLSPAQIATIKAAIAANPAASYARIAHLTGLSEGTCRKYAKAGGWAITSLIDVLISLIEKGPSRTQRELAETIFGKGAHAARVQYELGLVVKQGAVVRRGTGGRDPFKFFPARK